MNAVCCYDASGQAVLVPVDAINYSPAAYGILIERNQVLLLEHPETGFWFPPGGIISPRETPSQSVLLHISRVSSITPVVGPILFVEDQYQMDEHGQAWHLSALYYALERPTVPTVVAIESGKGSPARLVPLDLVQRERMQFGYEAVHAGRLRLEL